METIELDRDICYRALTTRDARFDGRFYTCVLTTGIYCRPVCPVRPPKREHCVFLPSAAAAHAAGYRPCLRCRPEVAPGLAGWRGTASSVSRALALIAEGALNGGRDGGDGGGADVERLAARLGLGGRHLRRLFQKHLGATPVAVAQAQRILFAKKLISETALPLAEVALAAGFGSVRRFNETIKRTYGRPPSALRRASGPADGDAAAGVTLKLSFTRPYDWDSILAFLASRAVPGVERVEAGRYRRTIALEAARGAVEVGLAADGAHLEARIWLSEVTALAAVVGRLRRVFDLDAEIGAIEQQLARDPRLAPAVAARPGLRVPGAWSPFELAVRAILGQQVSVAGARTLAGRVVERCGEAVALPDAAAGGGALTRLFPSPERLAAADLSAIGMPGARSRAVTALARAVAEEPALLRPGDSLDETVARLCALPGIGPWTAQYIAMRGLGEPDAFPASDLGVLRALAEDGVRPSPAEALARAEAWRPWRGYAVLHLWLGEAPPVPSDSERSAA